MRVYLAGAMRKIPFYNFPAFDAARDILSGQGCEVISPADLDREAGFDAMKCHPDTDWNAIPDHFSFDECVTRDIEAVRKCDLIFLLTGWETSTGARAEKALAEWLGKEIRYQTPPAAETAAAPAPGSDGLTTYAATGGQVRAFASGATRDSDRNKLDYEGFLSPVVLKRYAQYMNKHRVNSDGSPRDADNWQKGIPNAVYMKSGFRHFFDWWALHRGYKIEEPYEMDEVLCALLFNVMGYLHEELRSK